MEYVKLGRTGLDVSRLCLGTMGFGSAERWIHQWVLEEDDSRPVIKHALDAGINFFDTANVYSIGRSEEIVGKALVDYANRDEIVLATKVHGTMHEGPNGGGLSRKAILAEAEASLRRLGTDYIDLYIIHRWDHTVPIEETMQALDDLVRSGKVRYLGASAMFAWQFLPAQPVAQRLQRAGVAGPGHDVIKVQRDAVFVVQNEQVDACQPLHRAVHIAVRHFLAAVAHDVQRVGHRLHGRRQRVVAHAVFLHQAQGLARAGGQHHRHQDAQHRDPADAGIDRMPGRLFFHGKSLLRRGVFLRL